MKTSRVYIRDVTIVDPYPLLLFGGKLTTEKINGRVVVASGDGFVKFAATERVATLIQELKLALNEQLREKITDPSIDLTQTQIVQAIIKLVTGRTGAKVTK